MKNLFSKSFQAVRHNAAKQQPLLLAREILYAVALGVQEQIGPLLLSKTRYFFLLGRFMLQRRQVKNVEKSPPMPDNSPIATMPLAQTKLAFGEPSLAVSPPVLQLAGCCTGYR